MRIHAQVIPHAAQRYETSGDWQWRDDELWTYISDLGDPDMEFCEAIHEIVEGYLCMRGDITQKIVDDFDMAYEAAHQRGDATYPCGCPHQLLSDPGSDIHAPYRREHLIAESVEAILIHALKVDRQKYDELVEKPPR